MELELNNKAETMDNIKWSKNIKVIQLTYWYIYDNEKNYGFDWFVFCCVVVICCGVTNLKLFYFMSTFN